MNYGLYSITATMYNNYQKYIYALRVLSLV